MGQDLPPPWCPRYGSLDLWRGVACLAVVIHHATIYAPAFKDRQISESGGLAAWLVEATGVLWAGVPIFFVISGYCISATADSARRQATPLRRYFIRRFRRIYPPYWAALALLMFLTGVVDARLTPGLWTDPYIPFPRAEQLGFWQWLGSLTLTESWRPHLIGGPRGYTHALAWTLCYEEQFYAVVGLLLVTCPRRFFLGAALMTGLVLPASYLLPRYGIPTDGFFFDGYWFPFAAGILVYYARNYSGKSGHAISAGVLGMALVILAASAWPLRGRHSSAQEATILGLAFAMMVLFTQSCDLWLTKQFWLRPLFFCGQICYSLYLIHWPVVKAVSHSLDRLGFREDWAILFVVIPTCVAVSVAASWAFHVAVEQRFLNTPRQPRSTPRG